MKCGVLLALIHVTAAAAGILIECTYRDHPVLMLTYEAASLTCFADITSALPLRSKTPVKIIPLDATQRYQVRYFSLHNQNISENLGNVMTAVGLSFPKLRGIELQNVSIDRITKDDLKLFPELEQINLANNRISTLDSDLFKYTPKVRFIFFQNNNIPNVDQNLLNSVDYVETNFTSNPCDTQSTCNSELLYRKVEYANFSVFTFFKNRINMYGFEDLLRVLKLKFNEFGGLEEA